MTSNVTEAGATALGARIAIIGAGFGGLQAARALAGSGAHVRITLLDRHNYHTFTPLLYQVASAALEAEEIAFPVRAIFRRHRNVALTVAEVQGIDLAGRTVQTSRGPQPYDYLVVAAGSTTNTFGLPGVAEHSAGLKDLPQALELRNRLLMLFEQAAEERDPAHRQALLTILIVGGGPTGVELAGAFSELARQIIGHDFPALAPELVRIILVEAGERLLATFRARLSRAALDELQKKGIEVRLGAQVERTEAGRVYLQGGEVIDTSLVVWAAGVRAGNLAALLTQQPGRSGRVPVLPTLQLAGHPEVYVIGDMAELRQGNEILPMLAPVATQEGSRAGQNIALQIAGGQPLPFRYFDRGTMATLGRSAAIAQIGPISLTGFPAWIAWLALHLYELIGFRNRLLVLVNWAWDYFFFDRGVRIITQPPDSEAVPD
jgi:NADH dehydrogenase